MTCEQGLLRLLWGGGGAEVGVLRHWSYAVRLRFFPYKKIATQEGKVVKPSECVRLIKHALPIDSFCKAFVEHFLTDNLKPNHPLIVSVKITKKVFGPLLKPPTGIASLKYWPSCRYVMTSTCSTAFH